MTTFLICPAERTEVSALEKATPLAALCIQGAPFIHHWLEFLAERGIKQVTVLAADRPEEIRRHVGDGSRWGLSVEVVPESHELSTEEAQSKYAAALKQESADSAPQFILIDHLPCFPDEKLFAGYTAFFSALRRGMETHPRAPRLGYRELRPGIHVGLHSQISPKATLIAPCWIGENVLIEAEAEVGPFAMIENGVVIRSGASVATAWIGGQTFVGNFTQVKNSLASGNTLVNLLNHSVATVPDAFLLCALQDRELSTSAGNLCGRCAALIVLLATLPFALITILKSMCFGHRAFRSRRAVAPQRHVGAPDATIVYHELATANGWWKRWPQLWNVVRGEFAWVGNRPLTTFQAGQLENEFERLWLAAPIGLVSKGDSEGCSGLLSDEARAHASFYATQNNWRIDLMILARALNYLLGRKKPASANNESALKSSGLITAR